MKILNVDDTEAARYAKTRALRHAGFDVLEAGTGEMALTLVEQERPALVVLDVKLPDISGYDVCRAIKRDYPTTLILQTSALFTGPDARIRGLEGGADSYLHEPFDSAELIATVRALLRIRRAEEALQESEERLRLAQEAAGIGTWDWDLGSGEIRWSAELFRLHGRAVSHEPITLDGWRALVAPGDQANFEHAFLDARTSSEQTRIEYRIKLPDGSHRWLSAVGNIVNGENGQRMIGVSFDVSERKNAEAQQELMMRELNHRVRNTLAMVQAIILATARSAVDLPSFHSAVTKRIGSLAKAHTLLTDRSWTAVSLRELLELEFQAYEDFDEARIAMHGPDVMLPSALAVTLGMAFHELATNAAKYGALSTPAGEVSLDWGLEDADPTRLKISWTERNGPPVEKPEREGFGTTLLDRVVAGQIAGKLSRDFDPSGLKVEMSIDLPV